MTRRVWDDYVTSRDKEVYALGGFAKRGPLTGRMAVLVIDVLYQALGDRREPITESVKRFPASSGEAAWDAIPRIKKLVDAARAAGVPVIHVIPEQRRALADYGRYLDKMPAISNVQQVGEHVSTDIVDEVAPLPGERVVRKPKSSGFFKTGLADLLHELEVETVLVAGSTTSGCVRLTVADAFQHDFRAAVIEECVFDRGEASHAVNLWDMDAKYADVINLERALEVIGSTEVAR